MQLKVTSSSRYDLFNFVLQKHERYLAEPDSVKMLYPDWIQSGSTPYKYLK
jgi:hypothetical protein